MTLRKFGLLILAVALFFFAHGKGYLKPVEWGMGKAVVAAARPLARFSRALARVRRPEAVSEEIRAMLEAQSAEIERLKEEIFELERLYGYAKDARTMVLSARVIGKPADSQGSFLILDRGGAHGIVTGAPVVSAEGVLAGKVSKVMPATSVVRLLTDPESKIAATTLDAVRTLGVVQGAQGLTLSLTLVPRGSTIAPGMRVVTSGLEEGMPRGLLIGTIHEVQDIPSEPFLRANLTPPRTYDLLPVVGVVLQSL